MSDSEAERMIRTALDQGINFFDTAPNYGMGTSEERLGKVFKTLDRSKVVINSKFGRLDNGEVDFSSSLIKGSVERSLKRLKRTVWILSSSTAPPPSCSTEPKRPLRDFGAPSRGGKIKAYGASVDFEDEINTLLNTKRQVIQSFFNILHQDCTRSFDLIRQGRDGHRQDSVRLRLAHRQVHRRLRVHRRSRPVVREEKRTRAGWWTA